MQQYFFKLLNGLQALPVFGPRLRKRLLRLMGLSLAQGAVIEENSYFGSPRITIGPDVFINIGCFFDGSASITLGERVRIAPYVKLLTGSHPIENSVFRRRDAADAIRSLPIIIERGCWIGMGATIMPGVTIAEGYVIAAGAVVLQSTSANGLYAGVPAIRKKDLSIQDDSVI